MDYPVEDCIGRCGVGVECFIPICDTTADLFDGWGTILDQEIAKDTLSAAKGNLITLDEKVTAANAVDLTKNFASLISERIAAALGVPFYEDVALCHSKQRMNAVFTLNILPKERNLIVFDDFVTTGQTLHSMRVLLEDHGKNLVFFTGINNKL